MSRDRGDRRGHRGGGVALSLAQRWALISGLLADYDPSLLANITKDGSNKVSSFTSRVSGYNVAQATAGLQPVWSATSVNGFPGITYDGVDDLLDGASGLAGAISGSAPYTAYYVGKMTTAGVASFMTTWSAGKTSDNTQWIQEYKDATPDRSNYGRSASTFTTHNGTQLLTTAAYDHVGIFTGTAYTSYVNGTLSVNAGANTKAPAALDRISFGGLAYGATMIQPFAGTFGRWLIYSSAHTAAEIATVRAFLRYLYAI